MICLRFCISLVVPKAVKSCAAVPPKNVANPCSTFHKVNFFKILMCTYIQRYIEEIFRRRIFKFALFPQKSAQKYIYIKIWAITNNSTPNIVFKMFKNPFFSLLHAHYSSRYGIYRTPMFYVHNEDPCLY